MDVASGGAFLYQIVFFGCLWADHDVYWWLGINASCCLAAL